MRCLLLISLFSCGIPETEEKIIEPLQPISFCAFEVDGVCVIASQDMSVNPTILSRYLGYLEYEVNYYYPELDFDVFAESNGLTITYKWTGNNEHIGTYADYNTNATVWLRLGENITPKIACMDKYFVALHEVLHFIVERYMDYDDRYDAHNVPYIFNHWANLNKIATGITVESRLYTQVSRDCL